VVLCICCRWLCSCRQQEKDLNPPAWVLPLTPAARGLACQFPSRCYIASSPCRSTVAGTQRQGKASGRSRPSRLVYAAKRSESWCVVLIQCSLSGLFGRRDPHGAFNVCRVLHADGVVWCR
jgi:hypothetical protein